MSSLDPRDGHKIGSRKQLYFNDLIISRRTREPACKLQ